MNAVHYLDDVVKALRLAADRLDRGILEAVEPVVITVDSPEWVDSFSDARDEAGANIEPDMGEYHPDVEGVSWGVYVPVEQAEVEILPDDYYGEDTTPQEHGFDFWQQVYLAPSWAGDVETTEEHARLKAAVADYIAAWDNGDGVKKTILRGVLRDLVYLPALGDT